MKLSRTLGLSALLLFSPLLAGKSITIKGSDTMVHLVSTWAEEFMKAHPQIDLSVTGGGSGTGIAAIINKTTDICASSRDIKPKEKELAKKKGIIVHEIPVAQDALALIVHPKNPVKALTLSQVGKIYRGEITNWKALGGADKAITALSRESSSGTYIYFQEHVLEKQDYSPKVRLMPATSSIVQGVQDNQYAIGYVGLGYLEGAGSKIKALPIKPSETKPAVMPSVATALNKSYPISRFLYLYTNGAPQGQVKTFIDFTLSLAGQKIVVETGYVKVK